MPIRPGVRLLTEKLVKILYEAQDYNDRGAGNPDEEDCFEKTHSEHCKCHVVHECIAMIL